MQEAYFEIEVVEVIHRTAVYTIQADTIEEAEQKAKDGDTVSEKSDSTGDEITDRFLMKDILNMPPDEQPPCCAICHEPARSCSCEKN